MIFGFTKPFRRTFLLGIGWSSSFEVEAIGTSGVGPPVLRSADTLEADRAGAGALDTEVKGMSLFGSSNREIS